jgi:copper chaperone CopZ
VPPADVRRGRPKNYAVRVTSTPPTAVPGPADGPRDTGGATTAELQVEGMHCGSCVSLIEEALHEQSGVATATVDLESARAVVAYDPALVGPDQLCAAIAEAGYTAAAVG